MQEILIATTNPHKQKKLSEIVAGFYIPKILAKLEAVRETGKTFLEIAQNKAVEYSRKYDRLAISTDGGAVIPALSVWEPLRTRKFGNSDEERIRGLLELMRDKEDRTVQWHEALAVADRGKLVFFAQERAMDGVISLTFDPKKYREGIWVCSITDFPQFGGKNYFDLNDGEKEATEDSWAKLRKKFAEFMEAKGQ